MPLADYPMTIHTMCVIGIALILGFILVCFALLLIAGGSRSAATVLKPAPRRLSPDGRVPKPAPWPDAPAGAFIIETENERRERFGGIARPRRSLTPDIPQPSPESRSQLNVPPPPTQPVRDCITAIRREQGLDVPVGMEFHELLAEEMLRVLEMVITHKETPPSLLLPAIAVVKRARGVA